ncbi:MAG: PCC domain-containing protein, partial [Pseudonocardiaceae bacterium]
HGAWQRHTRGVDSTRTVDSRLTAVPPEPSTGAIVSLIGAVDSFTISTMPQHDATEDVITDYSLTGSGEIINGTVHIHAVMAVEGDQAVAGHLHRAEIGTFFGRAYIISS